MKTALFAKTYEGLVLDDEIRDFWRTHQCHPYGDIDYFRQEWENTADPWQPWITAIIAGRKICACAIGRIERLPLKLQFGYKRFKGPALTTLVVRNSGLIGHWNAAALQFLMAIMRDLMTQGVVDAVLLRMIPLDSPLQRIANSKVSYLRRDHMPIVQDYWVLNQPGSFDMFLRRHGSFRRNFRKYRNRVTRLTGNPVTIKCYQDQADIELMLRHSEDVARKTWQRKLETCSFLDHAVRSTYSFCFEKGWGRAYIAYLAGSPAAFFHGILYKGVFYAEKKGYDPSYGNLSLGTYLLMNVIEKVCADPNIHSMEFNVGNSQDKERYCDSSFKVSSIHLFAPGSRLAALNALRLMVQGGHQLGKNLLQRVGSYQTVKKEWRHGQP